MQVLLTDEQARGSRELAARLGISVAELVRRAVDRLLAEETGGKN